MALGREHAAARAATPRGWWERRQQDAGGGDPDGMPRRQAAEFMAVHGGGIVGPARARQASMAPLPNRSDAGRKGFSMA